MAHATARRAMDFAGAWYPADPATCERQIRQWWQEAPAAGAPSPATPAQAAAPRLGVAPHAGWVYSGRLAARVFQALATGQTAPDVELAIVLGGHLRASDPLVAMLEGEWETPFGALPIHGGFRDELAGLSPLRLETPAHYAADNSTELQLPLVRYAFPAAALLPMRVPPGPLALALGQRLAAYLQRTGLRAVAVASTDLTHYGPGYGFEPHGRGSEALRWVREENDPAFIAAVQEGDAQRVLDVSHRCRNACSAGAVATVAEIARRCGQRFQPLAYGTSDEVKPGSSHNFVGYLAGVYR